ncbi:FAD-dependent oxidoreductase [Prosthecochloris sp. N3]|uniref:FAD-dependent oxidoreductase n=1 Tax=Prosthecochloris ethylica TaxID=2743976 RepID=A0ABR9XUS9_9CHLB|nr:FAD-dependent oxidoreductase [Prosthecochloris ethylica]MBF0587336.1 FAD-dependent oxidoreductase [Prosthecochloris ethylica]MBF0637724.1 FAD-dependent oxidoreductase [Prosthecochloris ethylica]NUK48266.1 FAD-dependent oxidoreductase [Prosthecochloris ethylica]
MDRRDFFRTFLKRTAIGAGITAAGAAGLLGYYQPRREFYSDPNALEENEGAERLEVPKKAVVIGGGLAGMTAAMELAKRNFEVTLVEESGDMGGKLTGWDVDALGERFPVEHGFHGYFDQYYNLNELFAAAKVGDVFTPAPGYPVKFRERPMEVFGQTPKVFPLNILTVVQQSESLDMVPIVKNFREMLPVLDMFRYEYDRTFDRYDGMDFMTFCREREVYEPFLTTVLHPFSDATMNRMEVLSAAEALRYFHFYFLGSPEALGFRITRKSCMHALVDPVVSMLEGLGVTVRTGAKVDRLVFEGDRVSGVVLGGGGDSGDVLRLPAAEVREGEWLSRSLGDGTPVLVTMRGGRYVAFDATCTHMGCPVHPAEKTGGFFCPCHAGVFDAEGNAVGGPPEDPLGRFDVTVSGGELVLSRPDRAGGPEVLACDYCVLAANVRGTKAVLGKSDVRDEEFSKSIASLGEADPYVVWRLWLDRPVTSAEYPFYTVAGYRYTDSVSLFSSFQEPFISWAAKSGGSVVELHAYAIAPEDVRPDEEIRRTMLDEMHHMFPETKNARVLYDVYMQQDNFTRWAPGDHARRPGSQTPYWNLFLAGDWVKVDAPVFLMEAATFTGRLAANAIARKEWLRPTSLPIVPMDGIFA